jgi:hypothetical protein
VRESESYTDEQASEIWRRAAHLQAQRRLAAATPSAASAAVPAEEPKLSRNEVLAVAREAGIAPEFVEEVLREMIPQQALPSLALSTVGPLHPALHTSRAIDAPIDEVQRAMQEIFGADPFYLRLVDATEHEDARIFVFDPTSRPKSSQIGPFDHGLYDTGRNMRHLIATLRPLPSGEEGCTLTLQADANESARSAEKWMHGGASSIAGIFAAMPGAFGAVMLAFPTAGIALSAAATAVAGGWAALKGMRKVRRWSVRKDMESMEKVVGAVAAKLRMGKIGS